MIVQPAGDIVDAKVRDVGLADIGEIEARAREAVEDIFELGAPLRRQAQFDAGAGRVSLAGKPVLVETCGAAA